MSVREEWKFELTPTMQSQLQHISSVIGEKMQMKMEIGTIQKVKLNSKLQFFLDSFLITEVLIRFSGYPVKHQGVIEEICELASYFRKVRLVKVPAHADETGNEGADQLAKLQIIRNHYSELITIIDECMIRVERMFEEFNLY